MDIIIGQATDVGIQRKGNPNQDYLGVFLEKNNQKIPPLLVIADGMGGHRGGEQASRIVVTSLAETYLQAENNKDYSTILQDGIHKAHQQMELLAADDDSLIKMGSTVAAAIIDNYYYTIANVGDSRIYIIGENSIRQVSWEHSFVYDLVRKNLISEEEARTHPKRNVLTMSISAQREKMDIYIAQGQMQEDDVLLLCSDGLWGPVTEAQIHAVAWELHPQQAALKLVEMANRNHGPDNISVIIARYKLASSLSYNNKVKMVNLEDTQP